MRFTGEVRFNLEGDQAVASRLIPLARKQISIVSEQAERAGIGFLKRRVWFGPEVAITVTINGGVTNATISASDESATQESSDLLVRRFLVVGPTDTVNTRDPANPYQELWTYKSGSIHSSEQNIDRMFYVDVSNGIETLVQLVFSEYAPLLDLYGSTPTSCELAKQYGPHYGSHDSPPCSYVRNRPVDFPDDAVRKKKWATYTLSCSHDSYDTSSNNYKHPAIAINGVALACIKRKVSQAIIIGEWIVYCVLSTGGFYARRLPTSLGEDVLNQPAYEYLMFTDLAFSGKCWAQDNIISNAGYYYEFSINKETRQPSYARRDWSLPTSGSAIIDEDGYFDTSAGAITYSYISTDDRVESGVCGLKENGDPCIYTIVYSASGNKSFNADATAFGTVSVKSKYTISLDGKAMAGFNSVSYCTYDGLESISNSSDPNGESGYIEYIDPHGMSCILFTSVRSGDTITISRFFVVLSDTLSVKLLLDSYSYSDPLGSSGGCTFDDIAWHWPSGVVGTGDAFAGQHSINNAVDTSPYATRKLLHISGDVYYVAWTNSQAETKRGIYIGGTVLPIETWIDDVIMWTGLYDANPLNPMNFRRTIGRAAVIQLAEA